MSVFGPVIPGQRSGNDRVSLLVREPVSSVEQLLSGQPVVGDVAGLPADQIVRHDVLNNKPHQSERQN